MRYDEAAYKVEKEMLHLRLHKDREKRDFENKRSKVDQDLERLRRARLINIADGILLQSTRGLRTYHNQWQLLFLSLWGAQSVSRRLPWRLR